MGEAAKKWEPKRPDYVNQKPVDIGKKGEEYRKKLIEGGEEYQVGKSALEFMGELKKNENSDSKVVKMPEKPTAEQIAEELKKNEELRKRYMDEVGESSWIKVIKNAPAGMKQELKDKAIQELKDQIDFSSADDPEIKKSLTRLESVIAYYEQL
mgnify:CR=1 FL=1